MFSTLEEAWGNTNKPTSMIEKFSYINQEGTNIETNKDGPVSESDTDSDSSSIDTTDELFKIKSKDKFKYKDYKKIMQKCKEYKKKLKKRNKNSNSNLSHVLSNIVNSIDEDKKQVFTLILIGICVLIFMSLLQGLFKH
jgi:hypothetical protein